MAKKQEIKEEKITPEKTEKSDGINLYDGEKPPIEYEEELVVSGAEYWDFNEGKIFIGKFLNAFIPDGGEKAGETIGFNFEGLDGSVWIISNSYAIEKALQYPMDRGDGQRLMDCDCLIKIEFLGQGENSKGQPFNKFKVTALWPKKK